MAASGACSGVTKLKESAKELGLEPDLWSYAIIGPVRYVENKIPIL